MPSDLEEDNVIPFDPVDYQRAEQRRASMAAISSFEDNPDDAARAQELSRATGAHPSLVFADLEHFERQHKTTLTNNIVNNNEFIQRWINDHPLASKVSNDDIGQLDAMTPTLKKFDQWRPYGHAYGTILQAIPEVSEVARSGIQSILDIPAKFTGMKPDPEVEKLITKFGEQEGIPSEQLQAELGLLQSRYQRGEAIQAALFGVGQVLASPVIGAFQHFISKPLQESTGFPAEATEALTIAGLGALGIRHQLKGAAAEGAKLEKAEKIDTAQALQLMEYIKAGKEPPQGISPIYDQIKILEAEKDLEKYDDVMKEASTSNTKERSPELFAEYVRGHTDAQIAISASKIRELYGDKQPMPDDNLLGWVPDLADRLALEEKSGGYIEVPLADWVAKVDPEVAKELHDDIRVRRNGLSKNEVTNTKDITKEETLPNLASGDAAVDAVRTQLGAEGLFDRERFGKLNLRRIIEEEVEIPDWAIARTSIGHNFDIVDAQENKVGNLRVIEGADKKALHIEWVGAKYDIMTKEEALAQANTLGPRVIRDLLTQLKQAFPEAETLSGTRVSGARVGEAAAPKKPSDLIARIDLDHPKPGDLENLAFHLNVAASPSSLVPTTASFRGEKVRGGPDTYNTIASFRAADALDMIRPDSIAKGSISRALYYFFGDRLKELAGDVDVNIVSNAEFGLKRPTSAAFYSGLYHRIIMPAESIDGTYGKFWGPEVLMHELAHAATFRAVRLDPLLMDQWTRLMNEADKYLTDLLPQQRKQFNYAFTNIDEFIAESWSTQDFQNTLSHVPISRELAGDLGLSIKNGTVWDAIRKIVADILQRIIGKRPDDTILDGVLKLSERFEELHKQYPELREPGAKGVVEGALRTDKEAVPGAEKKPVAEQPVIKTPGTFGLTPEQYRRYQQLITKRMNEDYIDGLRKAEKEETKRQSKEWKANAEAMRQEVEQDMYNRPDIAANEYFRTGTLFGQKTQVRRIDPKFLTKEQRAEFPDEYVRRGGYNPDDVAGAFGYQSGSAMIDRIIILNQAQKQMGLYGKNFINRLIDTETDRRMQERYGDLAKNILQDAKDKVMNQTQLDIIHEDILRLGEKAGAELPFDRNSVKQWVRDEFNKTPMNAVDSDVYLSDAGKAGKAAEIHLLRGDFGKAFVQKQAQYIAALKSQEAVKVEKLKDQWDKNAKRYSKREVASTDQSYTNWIHDILMRVGEDVKRSPMDLANSIQHQTFKTLAEFVGDAESNALEVAVADFLLDPAWKKQFGNLKVDEFKGVHDSIKSLIHNGKQRKKLIKAGEARELDEVLGQMYDQLKEFGVKHYDASGKRWLGPIPPMPAKWLRTYGAAHLQIESLTNRWDKGDPQGLFTQYVNRDIADAAASEAIMEKDFSKKLKAIADGVDLSKRIENDVFMDPFSVERGEPTPINMTRKNLRAVMQHLGNESNFDKLAKGYHPDPKNATPEDMATFKARIMDWVMKNATKEDWDYVSKQGKIFADLKEEADRMYRRLAGIEPESLELRPIQTPFGKYEGWYHPLDNHPLWKGSSKSLLGPEPLEEGGYYRATTSNRYTQKRTGAQYPLALDMDMTPVRMKQMIHDINFREAIINAAKVIYDKRFLNAVTDFYGKEYSDLFIPWLKDVAGSANYRSAAQSVGAQALEHFRQNIIATLIGFNIGTVMKHTPTAAMNSITELGGGMDYLRAVRGLFSINEKTGESNWDFAMNKFSELQRRTRHYQETLGGAQERVMGELGPIEAVKAGQLPSYASLREAMIKLGSTPVAFGDLMSAVPMGLAAYTKAIKEGMTEGDAVFMANRAIRRAHGSTATPSRPAIARGGPLASYLSSLYGFFSHIMNRQFEMGWRAREAAGLVKEGEYAKAVSEVPKLSAMLFSYVLFPAIVEELVTPLTNEDRESWGKKAAKAIAFSLGSSWVGIRDFVHALMDLRDPQAGLLDASLKTGIDVARDLSKGKQAFDQQHMGATIQHTTTLFGAATGLTNAPEGRAAKFIHDYAVGKERPRGWHDWYHGLRFGTTRERR